MAHVYHVDQPGAPQAPGARFSPYILDILKACLVYGYGNEPGAGWVLIDEAPSWIVLRNGDMSGYVCIAQNNQVHTVSLAETYTGVLDDLIQGAGSISGVAAEGTVQQRISTQYFGYHPNSSSWVVVGDSLSFIVMSAGGSGSSPSSIESSSSAFTLYVGNDSNGNFIAMGGRLSSSDMAGDHGFCSGLTTLRDPATGLLVAPGAITYHHMGMNTNNPNLMPPTSPPPEIALAPMRWGCNGVFGHLRGLARSPDISGFITTNVAVALGLPAGIESRTVNTEIDLGDEYHYFSGVFKRSLSEGFLVTDNPEFW